MTSMADQHIARRPAWRAAASAALSALIDTAVIFGALGWLYVAVIATLHPDDLSIPIGSWIPVRRDTLGIICFGASAVAYFIGELRKPSIGADNA
jgi:uncharacterized RDD family membrane protein YckC